jgi:tetratricopeptide (TPR) repeat protein
MKFWRTTPLSAVTNLRTLAAVAWVLALSGCASAPPELSASQKFAESMTEASRMFHADALAAAQRGFLRAQNIAEMHDLRSQRVAALLARASVESALEQTKGAEALYAEALRDAQGQGIGTGMGAALAGLADAARLRGEFGPAMELYQRALAPGHLTPGSLESLQAISGQALCLLAQNQSNQARPLLEAVLAAARSHHPGLLPGALANIAALLAAEGQVADAIVKAEQALQLDRQTGRAGAVRSDLELLTRLYVNAGRFAEARDTVQRALWIAEQQGQAAAIQRLKALQTNVNGSH